MSTSQNQAAEERIPRFRQARAGSLMPWDHFNRFLRHEPSVETSLEDVLQDAYFLPFASELRQNDIIICIPPDSTWIAWLFVRAVSGDAVVVEPFAGKQFEKFGAAPGASSTSLAEKATVEYGGQLDRWQVFEELEGSGRRVLKSNLPSEAAGHAWLAEHRRMQGRRT